MTNNKTIDTILVNSFVGESQARNRYTIYSSIAKKEGLIEISDVFLNTAENEREHAKLFYKHITNGIHNVNFDYPYFLGSTIENLKSSAEGEHDEWETIYKNNADIAKNEGFDEISDLFLHIIEVEKHHEHRYKKLYEQLKTGSFFDRGCQTQWICSKCGYITIGESAPKICPCCKHPQGYLKVFSEPY